MNIKEFVGVNSIYEKPNGEKMSHGEVYTKVVNAIGLDACAQFMPASVEKLRDALQEDQYLNTIPLRKWDDMHFAFRSVFARINVRPTMSEMNCTLKQAARMLVAREYEGSVERDAELIG